MSSLFSSFVYYGMQSDKMLPFAYFGSYAYEASGPEQYAHSKRLGLANYRETIAKVTLVSDFIMSAFSTGSLLVRALPRFALRYETIWTLVGSVSVVKDMAVFMGIAIGSILAIKYAQRVLPKIHSDLYAALDRYNEELEESIKGREAPQEAAPEPIKVRVGANGGDLAMQSMHLIKSVQQLGSCFFGLALRPWERGLYLIGALVHALSIGVLFHRVSLFFEFPEKQVETELCDCNGQPCEVDPDSPHASLEPGGEMLSTKKLLRIIPVAEYYIVQPFWDLVQAPAESQDCTICASPLLRRVAYLS